jgi:hypothetical protein
VSPDFPTNNLSVKKIDLREDVASDNIRCTVSGWGLLEYQKAPEPQILQVVYVPFISYDTCRSTYNDIELGMICAGKRRGGKGACHVSILSCLHHKNFVVGILFKRNAYQ